jgi:hypothetical protein
VLQDECLTPFYLSPTQNILPFTQLVLKLVVFALEQVLDSDVGGTLSYKELSVGLRKINFVPPIHLSRWKSPGDSKLETPVFRKIFYQDSLCVFKTESNHSSDKRVPPSDDYRRLTLEGKLCCEDDCLDPSGFEVNSFLLQLQPDSNLQERAVFTDYEDVDVDW